MLTRSSIGAILVAALVALPGVASAEPPKDKPDKPGEKLDRPGKPGEPGKLGKVGKPGEPPPPVPARPGDVGKPGEPSALSPRMEARGHIGKPAPSAKEALKALRDGEADLPKAKDEARKAERDEIVKRLKAAKQAMPPAALKAEMTRHARRMAWLTRFTELGEKDPKVIARVEALAGKELARHARWMERHLAADGSTAAAPPPPAPATPPPATAGAPPATGNPPTPAASGGK
jgi:hypothetical protein